jgi:signal transduction histidine kinase
LPLRASLPPGTVVIVVLVCLAAWSLYGFAVWGGIGILGGPVLCLMAAATLAEAFPVQLEGVAAGRFSFAIVFIAAAAALYGWRAGAIVGALPMLAVELYSWRPVVRALFNGSLYVLGGAAAGVASQLAGSHRIGVISALTFYLVNLALLSAVVSRARGERYLRVAGGFYRTTFLPFVVIAATTAILVRLWRESPYYALLLAPPLIAIVAYQRSLVAAVKRQRELDKLKDEFIAVISHELRTPLASVYGGAVTLEQRELDSETQRRLISVVRRESARLAKLVDDVLWASRLDARRIGQRQEPCDPAAIAEEVVATAAELAPENISVVCRDAEQLPQITVDPEELRRVLANLVDNAVKYSPDGGRVEVSIACTGGSIRFRVTDQGIGIPEEHRERVFEKFTRLDPEMNRGIGGTGLGLYICKELVEQMGGQISVTPNEQHGSNFTFEIPTSSGSTGR